MFVFLLSSHHSAHKFNYIQLVCFHSAILISHRPSTSFSALLLPWQFLPFPLPIYLLEVSIKCILCLSYTIIKVPLSFSSHHPPLSVFKFRSSFSFTCPTTVQHLHFPAVSFPLYLSVSPLQTFAPCRSNIFQYRPAPRLRRLVAGPSQRRYGFISRSVRVRLVL